MISALTVQQLAAAHKLARWHGHLWATVLEVAELPTTADGIRAAVRAAHGDDIGIFYPDVQAYEYDGEPAVVFVTHTTGSGRLRWTVNSDGDTEITVSRPDGDLFNFCVNFGSDTPAFVFINDLAKETGIGQRHVDAAAKAISALTGTDIRAARNVLRPHGIEPCGPAYKAEKIQEVVHLLIGEWVPIDVCQLDWHTPAAELAFMAGLRVARYMRDVHVQPVVERPWERIARYNAEEELAALPATLQDLA